MKLFTTTIAATALVTAFQIPACAKSIALIERKCSIENSVYQAIGSSFLTDPKHEETTLNIVVFDRNLKRDRIFRNEVAPEYAFISGLGSNDYYSNNTRNREFLLGDVMWKFDRCSLSNK